MGKKDNKNYRHKKRGNFLFDEIPQSNLEAEKQKARKLRHSVWWKRKISNGICYYCGEKFSSDLLTMDHVIPLTRGGSSEKINIVCCCKECNNKKKYLLPVEWDDYLNRIKNDDKI